jgi:hypothetical protein
VKTDEDQFTQWASGEIVYDFGDGEGVLRVYTQEAWTRYCTHLLVLSGAYILKLDGPEEKTPGPDRMNELERAIHSLRQVVVQVATRPAAELETEINAMRKIAGFPSKSASGGPPDEKLCLAWMGMANKFFDPKRMLKYESAQEVLIDLRNILTEGLYAAMRP